MAALSIIGLMVLLFCLSLPISVSMGFVAFWGSTSKGMPPVSAIQSVLEQMDSFALMAVPFYIIAGHIMQNGGIARRLLNLAEALVGWLRGGLGASATLTSMFFSTVSGSSAATTAAIGTITIPAMEAKGYPRSYATSIVAASGELGAIIPPSLVMIVYGLATGTSISALFLAGIVPGILIGVSLMIATLIAAWWADFDSIRPVTFREWRRDVATAAREAWLAVLMPVVILGGIYAGLVTPTEAAVVAIVYGLVVSVFIYRQLTLRDILDIFVRSAVVCAGLMFIIGFASALNFALTINQVPQQAGLLIGEWATSAATFLLIANILLLVVGIFIEALPGIIILAPILAPIAASYGIDPIHFGMVMIINLAIGMITPPVGVNLFIACEIARIRMDQIIRPLLYLMLVLIIDLMIITYVPQLSLMFK